MGYYDFMGMNNYALYGNSPLGMPGATPARTHNGIPVAGAGENPSGAEGTPKKKTGFSGFFQGLKNGLVNTVKGLFSIKGLLITAATVGLVAATGGAALIPLAALGIGLGGYQATKGIMKGDTEQVGEGVFTMGASLAGAKIAPSSVGEETLANTSLWGKLKAPFIGKGAFENPDASFYSAGKEATLNALSGIKEKLFGSEETTGLFSRMSHRVTSGEGLQQSKNWLNSSASGGSSAQTAGDSETQVTFSERAQHYLQETKKSAHLASAYMGTVLGGNAQQSEAKEQVNEPKNAGETFYY